MFFSASKFRELVLSQEQVQGDVAIFFDPNDTIPNQFGQIGIKPIAVMIVDANEEEKEFAGHRNVLQFCQGYQPVVCVNPAYFAVNKDRKLQGLILQEPKLGTKGFRYSPCRAFTKLDEKLMDMILETRI